MPDIILSWIFGEVYPDEIMRAVGLFGRVFEDYVRYDVDEMMVYEFEDVLVVFGKKAGGLVFGWALQRGGEVRRSVNAGDLICLKDRCEEILGF